MKYKLCHIFVIHTHIHRKKFHSCVQIFKEILYKIKIENLILFLNKFNA